jgi:hypothetical protein
MSVRGKLLIALLVLAALVLAGVGVLYRATGVRHLQGV